MFKPWEKLILVAGALCVMGQFAFTSDSDVALKQPTYFASK